MMQNKESLLKQSAKSWKSSQRKVETWCCSLNAQSLSLEAKMELTSLEKRFIKHNEAVTYIQAQTRKEKRFLWLKWSILWSGHTAVLKIELTAITISSLLLKYFALFVQLPRLPKEAAKNATDIDHDQNIRKIRTHSRLHKIALGPVSVWSISN